MNTQGPLGDGISSLELLRGSGSDLDIVNAARVSHGKESKELTDRDKKLIYFLLKHKHTSPFEHNHLAYRIKAPIFIVRQWMRHRIGVSYNEISGRYAVVPLEFYTPQTWRTPDPINKQGSIPNDHAIDAKVKQTYKKTLESCSKAYRDLLDAGVCRELARGILPLCTYTQFIFTCNLASLFHFVKLRADSHAQWEIQQYAKGLLELARPLFPVSISSWEQINGMAQPKTCLTQPKQEDSMHV